MPKPCCAASSTPSSTRSHRSSSMYRRSISMPEKALPRRECLGRLVGHLRSHPPRSEPAATSRFCHEGIIKIFTCRVDCLQSQLAGHRRAARYHNAESVQQSWCWYISAIYCRRECRRLCLTYCRTIDCLVARRRVTNRAGISYYLKRINLFILDKPLLRDRESIPLGTELLYLRKLH